MRLHARDGAAGHLGGGPSGLPFVELDVPADVAIPERGQAADEPRVIGAGTEREAQPRPWIDAACLTDGSLRLAKVLVESLGRQERHARVVEGMAADQVPVVGHPAHERGEGLGPSALDEEGGAHVEPHELVDDPFGVVAVMRPIRMLRVERQGDARRIGHFSTPVITMPRMKKRCAMKNTTIGMMIVISVAACTSSTCSL